MKSYIIIISLLITFASCKSDGDPTDQPVGDFNLIFDNTVGDQDLVLNAGSYFNESDETYRVNELKYIISNISLRGETEGIVTIPQEDSYFVIDEAGNVTANLNDIPVGLYTSITFGFGVDPTKYPIESGTLNFVPTAEEAGMLWTWSAGYKFLKFEGTYSPVLAVGPFPFNYHVGSHGANLDNYKEVTLAFAKAITEDSTESLTINFDVSKIFDSTNTMSLTVKDDIQVDPENAPKIATNVATAFSIE